MHAEAPAHPGEHVRPGGQAGRQAIDRGLLAAIHHPVDAPVGQHAVQEAVLLADKFGPYLFFGFQATEMPVNIIGRTDIAAHMAIVIRLQATGAGHK